LGKLAQGLGQIAQRLGMFAQGLGKDAQSLGKHSQTLGKVAQALGQFAQRLGMVSQGLGRKGTEFTAVCGKKKRAVHDSPRGNLFQVDFQSQRFVEIVIGAHGRGNGQRLGHFLLGQAGFLAEHFVSAQTILAAVDGRHGNRD
jgi:hypothetical protein